MAAAPAKREVAQLVVIVVRAQHLDDVHRFSKQDPLCLVELSNSTSARTKVDKGGGQTPVWDEEFRLTVYEVDGEQQRLKITVLRQEHKDDAEIIGEGYVVIDGTWKDNEFDEWVEIKQDGKYKGEVFLEMTYYPAMKPQAPIQRRPSKLDPATRTQRGPLLFPLPADNASGRFVPALRPKLAQAQAQSQAQSSGRPLVPSKGVKAQAFVASPPPPTRNPPALPLPGDPEPPEIPSFLRPGRQKAALQPSAEEREGAVSTMPSFSQPHFQTHPQQPPPTQNQPTVPQLSTERPSHQRLQAHSQPPPHAIVGPLDTRPPPQAQPQHPHAHSDPQLATLHHQPQQALPAPQFPTNEPPRRWSGPQVPQESPVGHGAWLPATGAVSTYTTAPQPYQSPDGVHHTQLQVAPTPHIQVQTTGATYPANIPHGPHSPAHAHPPPRQHASPAPQAHFGPAQQSPVPHRVASPPSSQTYGQAPYPTGFAHAPVQHDDRQSSPCPQLAPHNAAPPLGPHPSQSPPLQHSPMLPAVSSSPHRPATAQPHHQELRPRPDARRSSSLELADSVPMPGQWKSDNPPPRPPKTPLAPPLPPPPPAKSPSPPPTPPRRQQPPTPPRATSPAVHAGRTKLEEFEREQQAEKERRRVEERERAQVQGGSDGLGDDERFDDAELPPPVYSTTPSSKDKGKGPAQSSTGDGKIPTAAAATPSATHPSASAAAASSSSSDVSSASRIHAGQAALARRIEQEREDARMAAALARENEQREAELRQERERLADEDFARMMREEEKAREEQARREREDEELARTMAEEGVGEEEARRRREEADEELARSLAEA